MKLEDQVDNIRPGVLNKRQMIKLSKKKIIKNLKLPMEDNASSFDLHLAKQGWEMKGSIKGSKDSTIAEITKNYGKPISLNKPIVLKRKKTYLIQLEEELNLQQAKQFFGRSTGKSSIGRLDVLTRLMVDKWDAYDEVYDGYSGCLYLEVTPITFSIKVKHGIALSQLRLFRGNPDWNEIKGDEIELFGDLILNEHFEPKDINEISKLRVDLTIDKKTEKSAFQALKKKNFIIDLTKGKKTCSPQGVWKGIKLENSEPLDIIPEAFYILRSKERFKLPKDVTVSCKAISETLGELRIHYAGFVHPFFGFNREKGTPVIFEVRGHNVKTFLRDGETLAQINFYRMSEAAGKPKKPGDYENQELRLSNYFKDWGQT